MPVEGRVNEKAKENWFRIHRWSLAVTGIVFAISLVGMVGAWFEHPANGLSRYSFVYRIMALLAMFLTPAFFAMWCSIVFRSPIRFAFLALVLVPFGIWVALVSQLPREFSWELFSFPFAIALPIVVAIELSRFVGRYTRLNAENRERMRRESNQFGLRYLFGLMTLFAVLFAARGYLIPFFVGGSDSLFPVVFSSVAMFLLTIMPAWAMAGAAIQIRFAIMISLSLGVIFLASQFLPGINSMADKVLFAVIFGFCWLVITLLLWTFRRAGYRFVRYERGIASEDG